MPPNILEFRKFVSDSSDVFHKAEKKFFPPLDTE